MVTGNSENGRRSFPIRVNFSSLCGPWPRRMSCSRLSDCTASSCLKAEYEHWMSRGGGPIEAAGPRDVQLHPMEEYADMLTLVLSRWELEVLALSSQIPDGTPRGSSPDGSSMFVRPMQPNGRFHPDVTTALAESHAPDHVLLQTSRAYGFFVRIRDYSAWLSPSGGGPDQLMIASRDVSLHFMNNDGQRAFRTIFGQMHVIVAAPTHPLSREPRATDLHEDGIPEHWR